MGGTIDCQRSLAPGDAAPPHPSLFPLHLYSVVVYQSCLAPRLPVCVRACNVRIKKIVGVGLSRG